MSKASTNPTPDSESNFLISGGGKGITADCAVALASVFHCRLTLFGRSALLDEEPSWAEGVWEETELKQNALKANHSQHGKLTPKELDHLVGAVLSSREIQRTLEKIQLAGGQAIYLQADIRNLDNLREVLSPIADQITGIIHGAGALADKHLQDKQEKDFELVYGVKVDGLMNLLEIIPRINLQHLVLFSSVAAYYGNPGQADYSLSNEVLNKFAHYLQRTQPDIQVLSINWGPWDGGMVSPQLRRILKRKNVGLISKQEGPETLIHLLSGNVPHQPQWVVGSPLPVSDHGLENPPDSFRIYRQLSLVENPFLVDHVIGGQAVLPTVCAVAWMINSCEDLFPGYKFSAVSDYRVFKGIVFNDDLSAEYQLDINLPKRGKQALVLEARISSQTKDGKQQQHYQAEITLRRSSLEAPAPVAADFQQREAIPGDRLYGDQTLFHGASFQGVEEVLNHSPAGLTTRCHLPRLTRKQMGQFPVRSFNPFWADVHLQSLLIWAHLYQGSVGLPLKIAGGTQYRPLEFGQTSYVTMTVRSSSSHTLVADVTSHDRQGRIFSRVAGAEITLSQRLQPLFRQNQLESAAV